MFELSVACKYLLPRRRQLSVSIISSISIVVIALVVWLVIVFFSVTNGLERGWIEKLTALTAPIRLTPTSAYYHSYYYLIDSISEASDYSLKTIREKQETLLTDPYRSEIDVEVPLNWPLPDRTTEGEVKDLVKEVYRAINAITGIKGIMAKDFELTGTHLQLNLSRTAPLTYTERSETATRSTLSYPAYLSTFDGEHPQWKQMLLQLDGEDYSNLLALTERSSRIEEEGSAPEESLISPVLFRERVAHLFQTMTVQSLTTREGGWPIPSSLLSSQGSWEGYALLKGTEIEQVIIPSHRRLMAQLYEQLHRSGVTAVRGVVKWQEQRMAFHPQGGAPLPLAPHMLYLAAHTSFTAHFSPSSLDKASRVAQLLFEAEIPIQGIVLRGQVPYRGLRIAHAIPLSSPPLPPQWVYSLSSPSPHFLLPSDHALGEGILLPKGFREAGVRIGDRGTLSYLSPTASLIQEEKLPIYVTGFYDPGLIPIGGKFLLASAETTTLIRAAHQTEGQSHVSNGINLYLFNYSDAESVKHQLEEQLREKGIARYWKVETYRDYEFSKEMLGELQSQKHLFMLIALVIICVACSNIISMLIILVNDKKREIGILQAMGASRLSIGAIFGLAGACIGAIGSGLGIIAAIVTLRHLERLVGLLGQLQGHALFSPKMYGSVLPHDLSHEALCFVMVATLFLSMLAGTIPAIKAGCLKPSEILRGESGS